MLDPNRTVKPQTIARRLIKGNMKKCGADMTVVPKHLGSEVTGAEMTGPI